MKIAPHWTEFANFAHVGSFWVQSKVCVLAQMSVRSSTHTSQRAVLRDQGTKRGRERESDRWDERLERLEAEEEVCVCLVGVWCGWEEGRVGKRKEKGERRETGGKRGGRAWRGGGMGQFGRREEVGRGGGGERRGWGAEERNIFS